MRNMRPGLGFVLTALAVSFALPGTAGSGPAANERIFFLDLRAGRILSAGTDGSDLKVLIEGHKTGMDGVVVDVDGRHLYWTNMGKMSADDGSIERSDLDGRNISVIVPAGGTFTPKQLKLDGKRRKLYWADREGMRIMRSNIDGSKVEVLVETGQGESDRRDARNWCVGIALDVDGGKIYWTQKGGDNAGTGSIRRANLEVPKGEDAAHRSDIELLYEGLPEPIDLDVDVGKRMLYWTDRGNPPRGNTVNRAPMNPRAGANPEILVGDLHEAIGIALDLKGGRMYFTDLGGSVYSAKLDGSDKRVLLTGQGSLTGIAFAELPK
jgi:DNA-binding beta-propeller fold protein YncE